LKEKRKLRQKLLKEKRRLRKHTLKILRLLIIVATHPLMELLRNAKKKRQAASHFVLINLSPVPQERRQLRLKKKLLLNQKLRQVNQKLLFLKLKMLVVTMTFKTQLLRLRMFHPQLRPLSKEEDVPLKIVIQQELHAAKLYQKSKKK